MPRFAFLAALLVTIAGSFAATAGAHPTDGEESAYSPLHMLHLGSGTPFSPLAAPPPTATPARGRGLDQRAPDGPCTEEARGGMPEGEGHDHQSVEHHRDLRCRIEQVAFLPLKDELAARPDVVLGEMDVKADIAAVAVIWPEGGILFFDVENPAQPKFLSWYRSSQCEGVYVANNCGAFVDLSPDGKVAFIAQQSLTFVPGGDPDTADPGPLPTTAPAIETVDIRDPRRPQRTHILPVLSQGGVHTARSHAIPGKGVHVFGVANSIEADNGGGIDISRLDPARNVLVPVSRINIGETHDTFLQNDPYDGKTYLYIAGGFSKGLLVYDVSDPASPKRVANWNLTPECTRDWYSHTVDVTHRDGKRIVTMPAEVFTSGNPPSQQSAAQQQLGCGTLVGNGDQPGPLWIIDATDFSKLGQSSDTRDQLKAKSEEALIASWTNPADRPAGNLTFSPHNQQIVGNRIYLSDYHGGVYVLDASGAFSGHAVRPRELGYIVPNGEASTADARPLAGAQGPGGATPRTRGRSNIWDMFFYKGFILAADQVGGFYSLRYAGDTPAAGDPSGTSGQGTDNQQPAGAPGPATRRARRQLRLVRNRLSGGRLRIEVRGTLLRRVRRVAFRLNGRRIAVDRRRPFQVTLRLRRPTKRVLRIKARVKLAGGSARTLRRTLRPRALG